MDNKSNMKQAMYEMFGVGEDQNAVKASEVGVPDVEIIPQDVMERPNTVSYLAAGTTFEGNLFSAGDVEIAGKFKGDIEAGGYVKIGSEFEGDIKAAGVYLCESSVKGNICSDGAVNVSKGAKLLGNVTAKELECAGEIAGDLDVSDSVSLGKTANVEGSISTDAISVAKGAIVRGAIEIKATGAPRVIVAAAKPIEKVTD